MLFRKPRHSDLFVASRTPRLPDPALVGERRSAALARDGQRQP
jgi:hypothetical protein